MAGEVTELDEATVLVDPTGLSGSSCHGIMHLARSKKWSGPQSTMGVTSQTGANASGYESLDFTVLGLLGLSIEAVLGYCLH